MTLRRCDSLPPRLREAAPAAVRARLAAPYNPQLPTSTTVPNFTDTLDRDQVIAIWKSLQTDVKKIKNGIPSAATSNGEPSNRKTVKHTFAPSFNNKNERKKIIQFNRQIENNLNEDRSTANPMDTVRGTTKKRSTNSTQRRKSLLQRLLSWKTQECNCRERYIPKSRPEPTLRPEDLLCTCGASAVRFSATATDKSKDFAERGRSKSVGYEAAREVTQFRRCASAGATVGAETAAALRARAALTLARRYYPEGGWGWTITVVGTIVQVLSHGLQLGGGTGAIACTAAVKYRVPPLYTHG